MRRGDFAGRFDPALIQPVIDAAVKYGVIAAPFRASEIIFGASCMSDFSTGRRAFLAGGAAALLGRCSVRTASARKRRRRRAASTCTTISFRRRISPPVRPQIIAGADTDPSPCVNWNPAHAIEEMDKSGVATALLSMSTPGMCGARRSREQTRKFARACNEYAAAMMRDYPGRFGTSRRCRCPMSTAALAEAVYALDVLKADGIGLLTSYDEKYPGDPSFKPLFAELNRRKAVVFVHPTSPQCCANSLPGIASSLDEFMFDVTRAITSMLFARHVLDRIPTSSSSSRTPAAR